MKEHLPNPDWTITNNGGFIHRGNPVGAPIDGDATVAPELPAWRTLNEKSRFNADHVVALARQLASRPEYKNVVFHTVGQVVENPAADACPWLAALCFDEESLRLTSEEAADKNGNGIPDIFEKESFRAPEQLGHLMADMKAELAQQQVQYTMSPAYPFHGEDIAMFDITAPLANKGDAVEFLMRHEHIAADHVIVAGDGGNDISMMCSKNGTDDGRRAIVVGGDQALYNAAGKLQHAILQPASMDCAEAVLDGLKKQLQEIARQDAA